MTQIALIHALRESVAPIAATFAARWPEATLVHRLDATLAEDRARDGYLSPAMIDRFLALGRKARDGGADAVLFTCSAFGPAIDAVAADLAPLPVHKPNTAMIDVAAAYRRIGLLASFVPTLETMVAEFPATCVVVPRYCAGALEALAAGDAEEHDRIAAAAARELADCDAIALAQFSLARAAGAVAAATGRPVLTTPGCAVDALRRALGSGPRDMPEDGRRPV